MICPHCGKEHDDPYRIKVQRITPTGKINLAEGRACKECALRIGDNISQSLREAKPNNDVLAVYDDAISVLNPDSVQAKQEAIQHFKERLLTHVDELIERSIVSTGQMRSVNVFRISLLGVKTPSFFDQEVTKR